MIALDEIDTLLDDTFKVNVALLIFSLFVDSFILQDETVNFISKFGLQGQSVATGVTVTMAGATFPTNFDNYL